MYKSLDNAACINMSDNGDFPIYSKFNPDIFSDFITDDDITDISDHIIDEETTCVETIEKEHESVMMSPEMLA